jgi:hypothetical protein
MRESNEQPISEVIKDLIAAYKLKDGLNAVKVKEIWDAEMGKMIAQRTTSVKLVKKMLYVSVNSSVLRNELQFKRIEIIELIKSKLGEDVIDEVFIR